MQKHTQQKAQHHSAKPAPAGAARVTGLLLLLSLFSTQG
ncbi:hypothetical protein STH12_04211 [Shewanella khirikhana]|jgi:hypothetical protein|uniref:Uncharacterized protein n=1 Tax=Shewanella khirikhana TaxID=1965282 RepID=A0ABM7DX61_9GAMM|nr:hypothetical protein STH12_04211 [Shewanella khirikhana]